MATKRLIILSIAATALLGACGSKEDLKPIASQPAPSVPVGATRAPTTQELTTPTAQARPARGDDLLKRSERREPDDFDLPPPG